MPKWHVSHRVPLCNSLGGEPLGVKLVRIWVYLLVIVESND